MTVDGGSVPKGVAMAIRASWTPIGSRGKAHGLRLQNEFQSRTGEVRPLNVGHVYTTLQRLERDSA